MLDVNSHWDCIFVRWSSPFFLIAVPQRKIPPRVLSRDSNPGHTLRQAGALTNELFTSPWAMPHPYELRHTPVSYANHLWATPHLLWAEITRKIPINIAKFYIRTDLPDLCSCLNLWVSARRTEASPSVSWSQTSLLLFLSENNFTLKKRTKNLLFYLKGARSRDEFDPLLAWLNHLRSK
jgi:hypothetical protein